MQLEGVIHKTGPLEGVIHKTGPLEGVGIQGTVLQLEGSLEKPEYKDEVHMS
jgi:hypothetical protein